jgi:integrase/recombinase XerD
MDIPELIKKEGLRRGLSPRTIKTYCFCVERFLKYSKKEVNKITKKDITNYLDRLLEREAAGNTINVYLNSIKFLMENILNKRLMYRIKYSKVPKTLPTVLTKEETRRLFAAIKNEKHKLMVKLMYSAGLRVSELVNLKIEDFEFSKNYGWVREGKGRKDRMFIIANILNNEIRNFIEKEDLRVWLFLGRKGEHLSQKSVQEIVKKASKDAKIRKNVHCHTLRHSFATHLIEDDYSISDVQSLLGHSSSETTMRYVHMTNPKMIKIKSPLDSL